MSDDVFAARSVERHGPVPQAPREYDLIERLSSLLPGFEVEASGHDERASLPVDALHALHEHGFDAAMLPRDLGGGGFGHAPFGRMVRMLAAADPALATVWVMHVGAGIGLAQLTRRTLGTWYADAFLRGERFANALSEPASGNSFLNPQQEATPVEGGYVLTGAKRFVSGSEIAQHLLVNVAINGAPAFFGVEPDESVSIIPIWDTLGLRGTRSQLLSFDNTLLRIDRRGNAPEPGHINAIGAGLPNISLGIADAALAAAVSHARTRIIKGRPLAHQQWVQYEIATIHSGIEAAGAYTRQALSQADLGGSHDAFGTAKLLANRIAVDAAQLAVRIGGASGFLRTSPIQRHLRDAQAGQLMAYSTEVLSGVIGRQVLGIEETPAADAET